VNFFAVILSALSGFLFYVLLYVRPFFRFAARLIGGGYFLGGLALMFFNPHLWKIGLGLSSIGFILFLVRQFYDGIIMAVCPEGMTVELGVG